jgi:hypothetical protein
VHLETVAPQPFKFKPVGRHGEPVVSGIAFSKPFRIIGTLLVGTIAAWMAVMWQTGQLASGKGTSGIGWLVAALAVLLYTLWHIWRSRTHISSEEIAQTWIWNKSFPMRELAYAKMIRIPGLDWLIAPRLYVRTLLGKFAVFYCCDPQVLAEFRRLVTELEAFRRGERF